MVHEPGVSSWVAVRRQGRVKSAREDSPELICPVS